MATTKRRRHLRKIEAHPELGCPTPRRRPYRTPIEAISAALRTSRFSGIPLRYYRCESFDGKTHFHLVRSSVDSADHSVA